MQVSEEMVQLVVLPVLLLCVTAIIVARLIVKGMHRRNLDIAAEGAPPTFVIVQSRIESLSLPQRDLRAGIIWFSIAVGLGILSLCITLYVVTPVRSPLFALGVAALPGAVGLGYFVLWYTGGRQAA
jgi:uncharacterized membrane protein